MSKYPEDLFDLDPAKAAELEQARLEAQRKRFEEDGSLPDPKDNPVYTMEEKPKGKLTPADIQNANEVVARNTAAQALSLPTGDTTGADANISEAKDRFNIVDSSG